MLHVIRRMTVISPNSITSICCEFPSKSTTCCATTSNKRDDASVGPRRHACCVDHKSDAVDSTTSDLWTTQALRCALYNKSTALATFT